MFYNQGGYYNSRVLQVLDRTPWASWVSHVQSFFASQFAMKYATMMCLLMHNVPVCAFVSSFVISELNKPILEGKWELNGECSVWSIFIIEDNALHIKHRTEIHEL